MPLGVDGMFVFLICPRKSALDPVRHGVKLGNIYLTWICCGLNLVLVKIFHFYDNELWTLEI